MLLHFPFCSKISKQKADKSRKLNQIILKTSHLRYFNFEPCFKLQWCRTRNFLGSQIAVTKGGLNCKCLTYEAVTKPTRP